MLQRVLLSFSIISALVTATPTTGLVLSSEIGKSTGLPAATHLDVVAEDLIGARLAVKRLTLDCQGDRTCLLEGAREASVAAVVAVSIAWGKKQTSFDFEAIRVSDGATLAQLTLATSGRLGDAERARLRSFAAQLADALAPDVPTAPVAEPTIAPPPPVLVPAEPALRVDARPVRPLVFVTGGAAVAAGIASGVTLGFAVGNNRRLIEETPPYRSQAELLANEANTQFTVSLITAISAGVLAVVTVVLLLAD